MGIVGVQTRPGPKLIAIPIASPATSMPPVLTFRPVIPPGGRGARYHLNNVPLSQ